MSRWGSPARRAALLGASAALVWAIDAAFVKAATDTLATDGWSGVLLHWPVYAVVVSGVGGTFLLEAAFAAGPLAASQSALLIVDPMASIAMGLQLFGEQPDPHAVGDRPAGGLPAGDVRRGGAPVRLGAAHHGGSYPDGHQVVPPLGAVPLEPDTGST